MTEKTYDRDAPGRLIATRVSLSVVHSVTRGKIQSCRWKSAAVAGGGRLVPLIPGLSQISKGFDAFKCSYRQISSMYLNQSLKQSVFEISVRLFDNESVLLIWKTIPKGVYFTMYSTLHSIPSLSRVKTPNFCVIMALITCSVWHGLIAFTRHIQITRLLAPGHTQSSLRSNAASQVGTKRSHLLINYATSM